jgi:hypothetical protein
LRAPAPFWWTRTIVESTATDPVQVTVGIRLSE